MLTAQVLTWTHAPHRGPGPLLDEGPGCPGRHHRRRKECSWCWGCGTESKHYARFRVSDSGSRPLLSQLTEKLIEHRHICLQHVKIVLRDNEDVGGRYGPHRGIAAEIREDGHFPKVVAASQDRDLFFRSAFVSENLALSVLDHIDPVSQITLLENELSRLQMLLHNAGSGGHLELNKVRRK